MLHDRSRIILPQLHPCFIENGNIGLPGFVNVLRGQVRQFRHPPANVIPIRIVLLLKRHGTVTPKVLVEKSGTAQPQPVEVVQGVIGIEEQSLEVIRALLPALPKVSAGEEARHGVPSEVVDPAFRSELGHAGIYPGVARPSSFPCGEVFGIGRPGHVATVGVVLHSTPTPGMLGVGRVRYEIVEIAPEQLSVEAHRRFRSIRPGGRSSVGIRYCMPRGTRREAA
mmetsp:Transcript_897/g.2018  ORF Transcript_897/g.2018 Transcript_897/m.2018 type:complete len:225 (-) Transcript_897:1038-1712(-)